MKLRLEVKCIFSKEIVHFTESDLKIYSKRYKHLNPYLDLLLKFPEILTPNLVRRFEDHRGSCHRVGEESPGCDNPHDVFAVGVCADGPADLHGRPDAEMRQGVSGGRLLGEPHR